MQQNGSRKSPWRTELNQKEGFSNLLSEQNTHGPLGAPACGYILESDRVMVDRTAPALADTPDAGLA
jgi:ABC-type branched-subunit amino acid transport system ATPase component